MKSVRYLISNVHAINRISGVTKLGQIKPNTLRVQFGQFSLKGPELVIKETHNEPEEIIDKWLLISTHESL